MTLIHCGYELLLKMTKMLIFSLISGVVSTHNQLRYHRTFLSKHFSKFLKYS